MRSGRSGLLMMFLAVTPLPSCSLMGLDDFGGSPCQSDADCNAAVAQLAPGPNSCGAAVCQRDTGFCVWQEGKEICNGKDDDCDGLIDEDLVLSEKKASGAAPAVPTDVASASLSNPARTFVAVVADGASQLLTLGPEDAKSTSELQYDSLSRLQCPFEAGPGLCNFAQVALAADDRHLVVASINTYGCAQGQVRVGLSDIDDAPSKVWLGKARGEQSEDPDYIAFGVDVGDGICTGVSRTVPMLGATHPAVASLGTGARGEGALLLWLATPANSRPSARDSILVEALGLVVPKEQPEWLNGTDSGIPKELGFSTSLSAPAVLAIKSSNGPGKYLVAFPSAKDAQLGIQLLTLRVDGRRLLRESSKFLVVGAVEQVSLALGNTERAELGLVWRSGSGSRAELYFQVVSMSDLSTVEEILSLENPWSMPTPDPRFAPRILYQSAGFATDAHPGGWFLSWVEATVAATPTLQVARIQEGTLKTLNHAPLRSGVLAQPVLYPTANDDAPRVGYALIQPSAAAPETFSNWCSDRD